MFIYLIVNHETGKYYVGQHKGNNLKKYLHQKFHHAQRGISERSQLYRSMRKHPFPNLWSIHALRADIQTKPELDETERDFIKFLRSQDPEYGYNICRGGEGFTGPHTEGTRKKMSVHSKQMWQDNEFRVRQSEAMKKGWSYEKRSKQAEISKKRWSNPEFKDKLSNIQKKAQTRVEVVNKKSEAYKRVWSNPERLSARGIKISEALAKPEEKIRRSKATKARWADPDYRTNMIALTRKLWTNPEYQAKMAARSKR